ncbi:MAG: hypothetical protein QY302_04415 [Anaerolineales bacterium]|nr:MAG: hypothetical protein QY302_04415 [Anaerolineales bacterium]
MKQLIPLIVVSILLAACVPQATATPTATASLTATSAPTETPIPTPTLHPGFIALQEAIAASGERFTLDGATGLIYDGANPIPGISVAVDGTITLEVDGETIIPDPEDVRFDDQEGITIEEKEKGLLWRGDGWEKVVVIPDYLKDFQFVQEIPTTVEGMKNFPRIKAEDIDSGVAAKVVKDLYYNGLIQPFDENVKPFEISLNTGTNPRFSYGKLYGIDDRKLAHEAEIFPGLVFNVYPDGYVTMLIPRIIKVGEGVDDIGVNWFELPAPKTPEKMKSMWEGWSGKLESVAVAAFFHGRQGCDDAFPLRPGWDSRMDFCYAYEATTQDVVRELVKKWVNGIFPIELERIRVVPGLD